MGVALGYYQAAVWMMVDAKLYPPEFDQAHADLRCRLHIPPDHTFSPKSQLEALRAKSKKLPFHVVGCF